MLQISGFEFCPKGSIDPGPKDHMARRIPQTLVSRFPLAMGRRTACGILMSMCLLARELRMKICVCMK